MGLIAPPTETIKGHLQPGRTARVDRLHYVCVQAIQLE